MNAIYTKLWIEGNLQLKQMVNIADMMELFSLFKDFESIRFVAEYSFEKEVRPDVIFVQLD